MADNFQITQGSGTFIATDQAGSGEHYQKVKLIDSTPDSTTPIGTVSNPLPVTGTVAISNLFENIATLCVSAVGTAASSLIVTLPAVINKYHVITFLEITKYNTANSASSATPNNVTTSNLPGNLAFTFSTTGTAGGAFTLTYPDLNLKSSSPNTDTVLTCPAYSNTLWRVNVFYCLSN